MFRTRVLVVLAALSIGAASCSSDSKSASTTAPATTTTLVAVEPTSAEASTTGAATTEAPTTDAATTEAEATEPETTEAPTTEAATTEAPTTTEAATTTTEPRVLEVLVTNDDGFDAAGIDAGVELLQMRPDMHVSVWAPLTNQSGAGDKTSAAPPAVTDVMTLSGYPAKAVAGFPADAVNAALASGATFDLIVSGSNLGQNYGPLSTISGTIGAAATGARTGIHAIAISQGFPAGGADYDFPSSATVLDVYIRTHLTEYEDGTAPALVSINVPTCPVGVPLLDTIDFLPAATDAAGRQLGAPTLCDGNPVEPGDDIDGFNAGHPVITQLDPTTLLGVVVQA